MGIISNIKPFVPLEMLFCLKYFNSFLHPQKLERGDVPRIYYVDAPDYLNLGDQAIAVAIKDYAEKELPEYEFVEVLQRDFASYYRWLCKNITNRDIIFLTGGGNMGNHYRIYEATRRFVISHFKRNKIVVFPQSISYTKDVFGKLSKQRSKRIYSKNRNLIICAREEYSFAEISSLYENKVLLCPDIVLSEKKRKIEIKRKNIGICLRDDIERSLSETEREAIMDCISKLTGNNETIEEITTIASESGFDERNRRKAVMEKISEIGECRLLITDRLHATIFAYLSGTPCIVLKNNNKKILGTMRWMKEIKSVCLVENVDQLREKIQNVLTADAAQEGCFNFDVIKNAIKG